jgi:hypothetical protein
MINWLQKHKFTAHLTVFMLMMLASAGLYMAANSDQTNLIWALLGLFFLANLVAMAVR